MNFNEVIHADAEGIVTLPQDLADILNSISISTTRGLMFSAFKETFLHNAFLPIIDPKQFSQLKKAAKQK